MATSIVFLLKRFDDSLDNGIRNSGDNFVGKVIHLRPPIQLIFLAIVTGLQN